MAKNALFESIEMLALYTVFPQECANVDNLSSAVDKLSADDKVFFAQLVREYQQVSFDLASTQARRTLRKEVKAIIESTKK